METINNPPSAKWVAMLIASSILSSTSLILVNKVVMVNYGFSFVLCLSLFHFLATSISCRIAARLGLFTPKRSAAPAQQLWLMAVFGTGSIVMMNFNLHANSVGFYQMTKLLCIPTIVLINRLVLGRRTSVETLFSLAVILVGVGLVTVSDVTVNGKGLIYGALAVLVTAQFQLWQGTKQSDFKMDAMQITDAVMPYQCIVCLICALPLEIYPQVSETRSVLAVDWSFSLIAYILLTCLFAVAVNIVSYALIGKTSAVTYQVVGHLKTILTLAGGFLLFPSSIDSDQATGNLAGILIALVGMILYGDVKVNERSGKTFMRKLAGEQYRPLLSSEL
jgi:solute carrier family 35 protein E3